MNRKASLLYLPGFHFPTLYSSSRQDLCLKVCRLLKQSCNVCLQRPTGVLLFCFIYVFLFSSSNYTKLRSLIQQKIKQAMSKLRPATMFCAARTDVLCGPQRCSMRPATMFCAARNDVLCSSQRCSVRPATMFYAARKTSNK